MDKLHAIVSQFEEVAANLTAMMGLEAAQTEAFARLELAHSHAKRAAELLQKLIDHLG